MKKLLLAGMLCGAVCARAAAPLPEEAAPPQAPILSSEINGSDLVFFVTASRQGMLLQGLGSLGESHAVTPEIKQLAAAVAQGQTTILAQLAAIAAHKQVTVATEPDAGARQQLDRAGQVSGAKFDKGLLDSLSDAEQQLQAAYTAATASSDGEIKAFAAKILPQLKKESARVRQLGGL